MPLAAPESPTCTGRSSNVTGESLSGRMPAAATTAATRAAIWGAKAAMKAALEICALSSLGSKRRVTRSCPSFGGAKTARRRAFPSRMSATPSASVGTSTISRFLALRSSARSGLPVRTTWTFRVASLLVIPPRKPNRVIIMATMKSGMTVAAVLTRLSRRISRISFVKTWRVGLIPHPQGRARSARA